MNPGNVQGYDLQIILPLLQARGKQDMILLIVLRKLYASVWSLSLLFPLCRESLLEAIGKIVDASFRENRYDRSSRNDKVKEPQCTVQLW